MDVDAGKSLESRQIDDSFQVIDMTVNAAV